MTEDEARAWVTEHFAVSRETSMLLERYVAILLEEMRHQNLIAESTRDHIWARHIVDSAQLLRFAPEATEERNLWFDLGAGAGLPGIIIAILSGFHVKLIEMRRKRVEFLDQVIGALAISNAQVIGSKVEQVKPDNKLGSATVISARAYAPMERLIPSALHLADFSTTWLLPKGQNYENELDIARTLWHSKVRVESSITAPDSAILVLENVRGRGRGKPGQPKA